MPLPKRLQSFHARPLRRIDPDHPDALVMLLQAASYPAYRPPRADARYKVRNVRRLSQNLLRRRVIVRLRIIQVRILVAPEILIRLRLIPPLHLIQRLVISQHRVRVDNLRPVCQQPLLALLARVLRHHQRHLVPQNRPYHRVGYPRVPRRGVQNSLVPSQVPRQNRLHQHPQHRPILDRPARIQMLILGEHLRLARRPAQLNPNQRRIPDSLQRRIALYEFQKLP